MKSFAFVLVAAHALLAVAYSQLRVLPDGKKPADSRLGELHHLNGYFPFHNVETAAEWEKRRAKIKRQTLVAMGLWPMPDRTPLNAVIHGRITRDDYVVDRVYFEAFPGYFATGSLYRPRDNKGKKLAGVISPHGHWQNGRFHDAGLAEARKEIDTGAEEMMEAARAPLQARCVQLARLGCAVFLYDMVGYADCTQISYELAHRFREQREEMNTKENWGLFSPRAESHLQGIMGIQAWTSIRALDFISSLPEVDTARLAVTGASGGGTQTIIAGIVDDRPVALVPAVMTSTAMQGGCTCENTSLLRLGTGNVELTAIAAPKPVAVTAANDWTKEMATKGFPELKKHYAMLGAEDHTHLHNRIEFGHNYNLRSRQMMYGWFNKHLSLGAENPEQEREFVRLTQDDATVWTKEHPKPEGGADFERKFLRWWKENTEAKIATDREVMRSGVETILGRTMAEVGEVEFEIVGEKKDGGDHTVIAGLLRNTTHGEELPAVFFHPKEWKGAVFIVADREGKAALYNDEGVLENRVRAAIASGAAVCGIDLLQQGEFLGDGEVFEATRLVENGREAAGYTFGYNRSVFAKRVHDLLSIISYVRDSDWQPKNVVLVAGQGMGAVGVAALTQCGDAIDTALINTGGFRFADVFDLRDPNFLPGGAKYGDIPGMLATGAPRRLWLMGEDDATIEMLESRYAKANAADKFVGRDPSSMQEVFDWVMK